MKSGYLISPATAASNSPGITITSQPVTFAASGLAGVEVINIQYSVDGTNWYNHVQDNTTVQLSVSNTLVTVYGPGMFRASKPITSASVGVYLYV